MWSTNARTAGSHGCGCAAASIGSALLTRPHLTLDCSGSYCPVPVNRTAEQVKEMMVGQILEVIGTDPGIQIDIPAWCISHGHRFLGIEKQAERFYCYLRVERPAS